MTIDEYLIALIVGTIIVGGFLLLSICAFRIQMHQIQMNLLIEQAQKRKQQKLADEEEPVEVS